MESTNVLRGTLDDGETGWVRDITPSQFATVLLMFEDGCDTSQGEYGMDITGLIGTWSFDDIDLLRDSVINHFDFSEAPKEGYVTLFLEEGGEDGGFPRWHKYYTIKHRIVHP